MDLDGMDLGSASDEL
jgi:hypothetical protein